MTLQSPPRCVAAFTASPAAQPAAEIGSVDGQNFFWSLGCRCSGSSFAVRSVYGPHFYLKHPVAHGAITLRCVACGRADICFDPAEHGLDAELDFFPSSERADDAELRDFGCPNCDAGSFEVISRFEYATNPAEEDLFTYFMLIVTCSSCRLIVPVADVQCA